LDAPHFAVDDGNLILRSISENLLHELRANFAFWGSELPRLPSTVPPRGNYRLALQSCEGQGPPGGGGVQTIAASGVLSILLRQIHI